MMSTTGVITRSRAKVQQRNNNASDNIANSNDPRLDNGASTSSNQGSTTTDVFEKPKLKSSRGRPKADSVQVQPKKAKISSIIDDQSTKTSQKDAKDPDEEEGEVCPVCFDKPLHPLTLECGHVYCFLCAKGLAESNLMSGGSCCLCRR